MRKFVVTIMASLLSCSAAFAFWPEATDSSLEIGVGYRQDRLEWKTSPNGDYYKPFGLSSEVKWRNLNIWQIVGQGKYVTCDNIYLRGNADYGWITSGKNRDIDNFNHRFDRFDDSSSSSSSSFFGSNSRTRGNVYDVRLALGYQFKMCDDSFAVAPVLGYSWHGQNVRDRRLNRFDYANNDCGCDYYNDRTNARYRTLWRGPFVGFDFDYRFGCGCEANWELFGTYEFHWARYRANAEWPFRRDLKDGFTHRSDRAYGNIFDIGVKYDFSECWTVALKGEFQWWWANRGHDTAKIAEHDCGDIETECFVRIPLRDVRWNSYGVQLLVGMVF